MAPAALSLPSAPIVTKSNTGKSLYAPTSDVALSDIDILGGATTDMYQRGRRLVVAGGSKIGKTAFSAEFPGCATGQSVFACDYQERGIEDLRVRGLASPYIKVVPPLENWSQVMKVANQLAYNDHNYLTAVFEGITGFEKFCFQHCCQHDYANNWTFNRDGFMCYQQGPKCAALKYWPQFLDKLEAIANRGVHVILSGHTTVKTRNTASAEFDAEIVYCHPDIWTLTHRWAEAILIISLATEVHDGKVTGEASRVIHCEKRPEFDAGNRLGITIPVQCGDSAKSAYVNFCRAARMDPATGYFV